MRLSPILYYYTFLFYIASSRKSLFYLFYSNILFFILIEIYRIEFYICIVELLSIARHIMKYMYNIFCTLASKDDTQARSVRSISLSLHELYACNNRDRIFSIPTDWACCVDSFE